MSQVAKKPPGRANSLPLLTLFLCTTATRNVQRNGEAAKARHVGARSVSAAPVTGNLPLRRHRQGHLHPRARAGQRLGVDGHLADWHATWPQTELLPAEALARPTRVAGQRASEKDRPSFFQNSWPHFRILPLTIRRAIRAHHGANQVATPPASSTGQRPQSRHPARRLQGDCLRSTERDISWHCGTLRPQPRAPTSGPAGAARPPIS
jgi:hypothetical protein